MTNDLGPAVRFPPPLLFVAGLGGGVLLDLVLWLLHALEIVREERHLRQAFPAEYDAYCRRFPRWS